jgi:hypothetical protein
LSALASHQQWEFPDEPVVYRCYATERGGETRGDELHRWTITMVTRGSVTGHDHGREWLSSKMLQAKTDWFEVWNPLKPPETIQKKASVEVQLLWNDERRLRRCR